MNGKSRIGVMPRFGSADSVLWFDVDNHCSYHLFNCFEDGNEVITNESKSRFNKTEYSYNL
jgi:carotenoid cleavage dioxygenase